MNALAALESLEAAARGNARLEALKEGDSPQLRKLLTLALSPQVTFGVKKLPEPLMALEQMDDSVWYRKFLDLLEELSSRRLTGNAAQQTIAHFLGDCDDTQRKWSERIIKQDLRLDIGAKDVNNTLGEGTIFQFTVPLAEDYAKVKPNLLAGKWCVEPKLDGARCVAFLPANKGRVQLFSRTGKEWLNFEPVREKLQEINNTRNPTQSLVLDGEVVVIVNDHIDFQALQHVLFKKGGDTDHLKYLLFDATTQAEWEKPTRPYRERYEVAREFVQRALHEVPGSVARLGVVEMFETIDPDPTRMLKHSTEFVYKGFEGAMYRRSLEPVLLKRSRALLKVKSFVDDEATVVGAVVGNGKYAGMLGALECKSKDGKLFEIGSGFSDEQRRLYWKEFNAKRLPKQLTYKYFELTEDGKPRFPIFKGFRHEDDIGGK
jgi:DNA ligase-1